MALKTNILIVLIYTNILKLNKGVHKFIMALKTNILSIY